MREHLSSEQIATDEAQRWTYGYDNSREQVMPDVVVFPDDHQQVLAVMRACIQWRIPIVARGKGTGTVGGSVPLRGGVVLSTERMTKVVKIDPPNRLMIVEPGITNKTVQTLAAEHGFFWPPDPTSAAYSTIGGNLAYNSAGPRAVKYGTPRENTLGLLCVTGSGATLRTGTQTTKGVVGYDLTRLLIGSEGTLGIITEATLKLTPKPQAIRTIRALFDTIDSAAHAVAQIMSQPVIPYVLEFIDAAALDIVRTHANIDLPDTAHAMLMIEIDGPEATLDDATAALQTAASVTGLIEFKPARNAHEVAQLWHTRKALSPALRTIAPKKINEDVVVPVSNIPALINGLDKLSSQYQIPIVNFGHAGNGNIHVNLLIDTDNAMQMQNMDPCLDAVFSLVLKLNGSLSGEHGVGIAKRAFVDRELDATALTLMRQIKLQFDPHGLLNPDKIFPL